MDERFECLQPWAAESAKEDRCVPKGYREEAMERNR